MRIKDVEKRTGLSRKSIRFYESRGLLQVGRSENSYREYDDAMITQLKAIAVLRKAGASISDIQLWQDDVITTQELLHKRLSELKDSSDVTAAQTELCRSLLDRFDPDAVLGVCPDTAPDEKEVPPPFSPDAPLCLGIDIGTTTISSVVLDLTTGSAASYTVKSDADLPAPHSWEKLQDVQLIEDRVRRLTDSLLQRYPGIRAIGFTGQMHGILYVDSMGTPLSPLYTWQDERAGHGSPSACDILCEKTGYRLSNGYGLATHFALALSNELPAGAAKLCTVMDYLAYSLCGKQDMLIHSSNAASLGLYDVANGCFDPAALNKANIDPQLLPPVTNQCVCLGTYRQRPVSIAIGDNQASFLGTAAEPDSTVLANFGTGSQVSLLCGPEIPAPPGLDIEIRPFLENRNLICGCALCGGRAYALLEQFFRSFISESCGTDQEQYTALNRLALLGLAQPDPLQVQTTFCGTRSDPTARGSIFHISESSFTPAALAAGVLTGMAQELHGMYLQMPHPSICRLVASGNAIRKNPALRKALEQVFGMSVLIPAHQEEAAYGAALFGAAAARLDTLAQLQRRCIHYQSA